MKPYGTLPASRYEPGWRQMWQRLGVARPDPALLPDLLQRYSEPQRKYHTLQHLDACLAHFEALRDQASHPEEVELALWYHDAVYVVRAKDNEQLSADMAHAALLGAGASEAAAQRVHAMVLVSRHDALPRTTDESIFVDVDLAILGAPQHEFDAYEDQIRSEFISIPAAQLRSGRRAILQAFLGRPRIYHTTRFFDRFEAQARANLRRSIEQLRD
jgi:predicted metal-dependent HD superfamily phosphohydrolase